MISRMDAWIGIRLFHPPIIWLCQRVGMSQYAVAAYAWLAATFTLVARMRTDGFGEILMTILISLLAVTSTVVTALYPDTPRRPSLAFRIVIWAFVVIDILHIYQQYQNGREVHPGWGCVWDVLALIGEYAKTISTIPPRKRREKQAGRSENLHAQPQSLWVADTRNDGLDPSSYMGSTTKAAR